MKVKTEAIIYKAKEVTSKKTGAIYKIIGLIVDGVPKDFFSAKKEIAESEVVQDFEENGNPFKVQAEISVKFSGARTFVDLENLDFAGDCE